MKTPQIPSKDELERQKLSLEIRELERRWWQRPVYLSVLLPMVLASLTVLAGILSGYFNRERVRLTRDIEALKGEKTALLETQKTIRQASADAKERLKELTEDYVRRDHQARQAYEELVAATLPGEDPEIIRKVAASFLPKGIPTPTPTPKQKK